MNRKSITLILIFSLLIGIPSSTLGISGKKIVLSLNDIELELENEVFINQEGKMMIPLRRVFEELNYKVEWNEKEEKVKISNESKEIVIKIGDFNSVLKDRRTFIPLDFLSNKTDLIIGIDKNQEVIKINNSKKNKEKYFKETKDTRISNSLKEYMKSLERHQKFYGAVLIAKDGELLLNEGYGFSDLNQEIKNKSNTKFGIGSITKQFTAMGIMQLVEKDLIKVEDKVSKYIPEAPYGDKISIYNLLTHTSGLSNYTNSREFINEEIKNRKPMELVESIKEMPLKFEPGEKFEYSNTGYVLLGMIIESVSGESLEDYISENIFKELNMSNTGISYGENNQYPDATPYTGNLQVKPIDDEVVLSQFYGAGSMYSTVEDLYRWDRALNSEKLVKKETINEMFKEHISMGGKTSYGYGWMIENTDIGKKIYHGGNTFGYSSNIVRFTDEDITIIILVNKANYHVEKLTEHLINITLGKK